MGRSLTYSQKLALGFGAVVAVALIVAAVAVLALREVVTRKDQVIDVAAQRLVHSERLHSDSARKAAETRAYLMSGDPKYLAAVHATRARFRANLDNLTREVQTAEGAALLKEVDRIEELHDRAVEAILAQPVTRESMPLLAARTEREVRPLRDQLDQAIDAFVAREDKLLQDGRAESTEVARSASRWVLVLSGVGVLLAALVAALLARTLAKQISTAARHVQTSSAELQAAAGQQATGAKQQATAMAEITTTITELLATSRQIAESAKRVAGIAAETATAARAGDQTLQRSQDSVGSIRRQVELIVNHMLELGRKSQQIGSILEIIDELAEQTNILAINATIEAAGAGESGKRFAVVAEEIRKLADRVGGSTKDIRALIDEVRSAVNTTVMATESGSKAVETGARQFTEVTAVFGQIARLVSTTTDAAREIELSTKQQTSAVEQVNSAISNVAQATREAEASSGQALETASLLATMSSDLARLVQSRDAA
ncbi:MAG TPA: methyl-accepting chemotaxis protein [Anaeromyxobacteraceae bacterium]|nr:methyl-accepting chemotaxis protein [Anaeromyxobacteraceae bacterium]